MVVVKSLVTCSTPIVGHIEPDMEGEEWELVESVTSRSDHSVSGYSAPSQYVGDPPEDLRDIGAYTFKQARDLCEQRPWLWVVDDLFPTRSINIISSEPKAGKSTLIRSLLWGVTNGERFLNRVCKEGPAVHYTLDEQMDLTVEMFDKNLKGAEPKHPLYLVESFKATDDLLSHMHMMNKVVAPVLFVVDTLQHGLLMADINDYAKVVASLNSFIEFAHAEAPQATIVFVHHNHKVKENERGSTSANRIAGSVALHGCVFTAMVMDVDEETGIRYIGTSQRRGDPMVRVPLALDRETLRVMINGPSTPAPRTSDSESRDKKLLDALREACDDSNAGVPLDDLSKLTGIQSRLLRGMVNRLIGDGKVIRTGTGSKLSPFRIHLNPTWR